MTGCKSSSSPTHTWGYVKTEPDSLCINPALLSRCHDPQGDQVNCFPNPTSTTEDVKQLAQHEHLAMDGHSTPFIATPSSLDGSDHWPTFSDTDRDTPGSFVDVKIEEASSPTEAFDQLCLSADCVFVKEEAAAHVDETASEPPSAGSIIEPIASGSTNKRSGRKLLPASSRRKVYSEQEPYAKLIQRALLSKSDHCMSLQELYQWFREHTDKTKDEDKKGWQNSIRHNLSMNHGFVKLDEKLARNCKFQGVRAERKRSTIWTIEDWVLVEGIQSTTRYRKGSQTRRPNTVSSASRKRAVLSNRLHHPAAAAESHVNGSTTRAGYEALEHSRPVLGQHPGATAMPPPGSQGGGHREIAQIPTIAAAGSPQRRAEPHQSFQAPDSMQAQPQHGVLVPYPPREQEARTLVAAPESVAWAATPDPMVIGVPSGTTIYRQSPSMLKPLEHAEYLFLLSALHAAVTSNEPVMAPQGQAVQLPLGYTSVSGENAPQYAQGLEQTLLGRSVVSQGHVTHLSSMVGGVLERTASTCPSEDVASSLDNVCPDTH